MQLGNDDRHDAAADDDSHDEEDDCEEDEDDLATEDCDEDECLTFCLSSLLPQWTNPSRKRRQELNARGVCYGPPNYLKSTASEPAKRATTTGSAEKPLQAEAENQLINRRLPCT
ncbi:hypothetical protein CPB85DRAFT_1254396 [Mucidula mucida]|nr:hypothetical protein CPB85DRAFT_1254396 [Mucidula mucida]